MAFPIGLSIAALLILSGAAKADKAQFFPFGTAEGDATGPGVVSLPEPFLYFGNPMNNIYVIQHGYLTIYGDTSAFVDGFFTSLYGGNMTHRLVTTKSVLDKATKVVKQLFPGVYFSATSAFIATWENMQFNSGTATFQVVLVWGGSQTYFLYIYGHMDELPSGWKAGYGLDGPGYSQFAPPPSSSSLPSTSNVNLPGIWAFRMNKQSDPCQVLHCDNSEVCRKVNGAYGCGCQTSSDSDSFDAAETCMSSSATMSLSRCQLFEVGINANSLHLNDPTCTGVIQNGRVTFKFDNSQNICGTTLGSNATHFFYENSVQRGDSSDGLISRHSWVNINFTCAYPLIQHISMPMVIQASRGVVYKEIQNEGSYQIIMLPYPNASFITPYSGDVLLNFNQRIFVSVEVKGVDATQISTVLNQCWATPNDDINNTIRWDLITNDCPQPEDGTVEVLQNGQSTTAQFSFRMFTFTKMSDKVHLHCEVHLCLRNKGNCVQRMVNIVHDVQQLAEGSPQQEEERKKEGEKEGERERD
ncbi:hypothetical protein NFI96_007569 [Prochilodus magdalenae]|nr:hypothetical protein NFI96_007569 [Prochilodus magdalenae]